MLRNDNLLNFTNKYKYREIYSVIGKENIAKNINGKISFTISSLNVYSQSSIDN